MEATNRKKKLKPSEGNVIFRDALLDFVKWPPVIIDLYPLIEYKITRFLALNLVTLQPCNPALL
jgi:hypothetical protein